MCARHYYAEHYFIDATLYRLSNCRNIFISTLMVFLNNAYYYKTMCFCWKW